MSISYYTLDILDTVLVWSDTVVVKYEFKISIVELTLNIFSRK